ncbi:response regulator transcription factor [Streptomyces sp. NPDC089919]|uniref:response regulator transcription factor n=1 Tax=Streptomyces sp. NPDC089919 TaxID=3155188 RepID=UPI00343B9D0D
MEQTERRASPASGGPTIRVLVVDDEGLVRAGLRMVLTSSTDITVVAEAADGAAAVETVRTHRPDVVVMDVQMPLLDGLAATRRIRALPDPPAVLLLTTFDLDSHVQAAVDAGASGYLLKNTHHEDLLAAVRAVHRGDAAFSPPVARRVLRLAGAALPEESAVARLQGVGEADLTVLALVGKGLSNAAIAARLGTTEPAVKRRVRRLLAELGCANRVQLAIAAVKARLSTQGD